MLNNIGLKNLVIGVIALLLILWTAGSFVIYGPFVGLLAVASFLAGGLTMGALKGKPARKQE